MLAEKCIQNWIQKGPDLAAVKEVEDFGRSLSHRKLTTSQIRQVFTRFKTIEAKGIENNATEFLMLKPYLAYAASRSNAQGLQDLKDAMSKAIDMVMNSTPELLEKHFKNFCSLFEAILAYHRAEGGK